jgi:dUTP pyrophosphatase
MSSWGLVGSPPKVVFHLDRLSNHHGTGVDRFLRHNREDVRTIISPTLERAIMQLDAMRQDTVVIKVLKLHTDAQLPRYAHTGPFGDLAADLYAVSAATLDAGATLAVATGIALEFPATHGALVEDRSGLAVRGVTTLAGVIDPGYRGEIKVVMTNLSAAAVEIKAGDRIAQLRIVQRIEARFDEVTELVEAPRGAAGFGSTGH